jgi:triosephosphate isomerase
VAARRWSFSKARRCRASPHSRTDSDGNATHAGARGELEDAPRPHGGHRVPRRVPRALRAEGRSHGHSLSVAAEKGAFTGETSATIAKDAGAGYVLVGHSERRHVFGETDAETAEKCSRASAHGLVPVLCVGEKIEEREAGATEEVVLRQLRAGLAALAAPELRQVIIAYEPVWAIGTGRTATPQDASSAHAAIRGELRTIGGSETDEIPILYGGSVNVGNASTLLKAPDVDGLLVGGASLEAESWANICGA